MSFSERIKELIEEKGVTAYRISKDVHINQTTIANYLQGKTEPNKSNIRVIANYFKVNEDWLLTGTGNKNFISDAKRIEIDNFINAPLVPVRASAGYLNGYNDMGYIDELPTIPVVVDKSYKGKYMCFEVEGDSMDDGSRNAICDKDIVLGREVKKEHWRSKLHIRDWDFIIVHKTEGITIKTIIEHDTENCTIKCHPTNTLYDDFSLSLEDVLELYNVIKIVDRSTRR